MSLDTVLTALSLPITLTVPTVAIIASYRHALPYKVVGHSYDTGMMIISWRDEPGQTHWLTPAHLQQQIGAHR